MLHWTQEVKCDDCNYNSQINRTALSNIVSANICLCLLIGLTVMAKLSPGGGYREFTSCRFYSFSILWGFVYLHARLNNWTHLILFKNMNIE